MVHYEFVQAKHDDIPEIIDIYHSLIGTEGCSWNDEYPNKETAESDIESQSLYVLKKDGKIVATASVGEFDELASLEWSTKNPCELSRVGVIPSFQNQGIATLLLKNIIDMAKNKGYDGIRMLVSKANTPALALYNKNGFEKCGEVFMFEIDFYCYEMKFV